MTEDEFAYDYYGPEELSILLKEGEGKFMIDQVILKLSTSGNKMLEIKFRVIDSDGKEMDIYDYLVVTPQDEAGMKRLNTKIMNIGNSINKPQIHAKGYKIKPSELLGERGRCMIKTQKDTTGKYPDRSVISKYIDGRPSDRVVPVTEIDDSLPF